MRRRARCRRGRWRRREQQHHGSDSHGRWLGRHERRQQHHRQRQQRQRGQGPEAAGRTRPRWRSTRPLPRPLSPPRPLRSRLGLGLEPRRPRSVRGGGVGAACGGARHRRARRHARRRAGAGGADAAALDVVPAPCGRVLARRGRRVPAVRQRRRAGTCHAARSRGRRVRRPVGDASSRRRAAQSRRGGATQATHRAGLDGARFSTRQLSCVAQTFVHAPHATPARATLGSSGSR